MDGWMIAFFSSFSHPRITKLEQEEGRKNRVRGDGRQLVLG